MIYFAIAISAPTQFRTQIQRFSPMGSTERAIETNNERVCIGPFQQHGGHRPARRWSPRYGHRRVLSHCARQRPVGDALQYSSPKDAKVMVQCRRSRCGQESLIADRFMIKRRGSRLTPGLHPGGAAHISSVGQAVPPDFIAQLTFIMARDSVGWWKTS